MGLTYSEISLENSFTKHRMEVRALVDSGSVFLTVPEHIAIQLGFDLQETSTRRSRLGRWLSSQRPDDWPVTSPLL
jgi:hypothetical protein